MIDGGLAENANTCKVFFEVEFRASRPGKLNGKG
jgi:hypothetical protein